MEQSMSKIKNRNTTEAEITRVGTTTLYRLEFCFQQEQTSIFITMSRQAPGTVQSPTQWLLWKCSSVSYPVATLEVDVLCICSSFNDAESDSISRRMIGRR
jgi:hypothetical protein